MADPFLVVLDSAETASRALLSALAQTKNLAPERARLLRYGIERVELLLTLCKQTIVLASTPSAGEADGSSPLQLPHSTG